jgi:hypothetical protein
MKMMGVVRAKIQTVEDIGQLLLRTAVVHKHPIRGVYGGGDRWLCPHRLGRNQLRVLCYQYGGQSDRGLQTAGSPANWQCIAVEKFSRVEVARRGMADCA